MTDKPAPFVFKPAPRPTPRVTADVAERLADATADLGFTRPSSAPPVVEPVAPTPSLKPAPRPAAGRAASRTARTARPVKAAGAPSEASASLKFDVPEDLWTALKIEAAKRRVTVKFLVLEALSRQGYEVDLDAIPEDGRRLR